MSVRLLVWALIVQLLLAGVLVYFAVAGFPFLPDHGKSDCRPAATAARCGSGASRSRTRDR